MKTSLIFGIGGQDGACLARHLLARGDTVIGTSRDAGVGGFGNLVRLGLREQVRLESAAITDFRSVLQVISRARPDEIYNLAGQTSVGLSFDQPVETLESIALGTLNILEAMRFLGGAMRFYNACSSECFGDTHGEPADEETAFRPRSPYGAAKAAAFWEVANYREAYGLYACSGILFNHESSLRPERFVTQKIVQGARRIASGELTGPLRLGNLSIERDWGWAPEFVEAMALMLRQEQAEDFVIATGETRPLRDFVAQAFSAHGLDWQAHVVSDPAFLRPTDLAKSCANPAKAARLLGWRAQRRMDDVVRAMVAGEL
ncbi:MAG: GDP-mannose 4,6-dehydratase [Verrucomicrobia bacterium]|nr:GDP-mannose 4,6-dehydratase [Verrucomicrobiota bacterium]